MRHILSAIIIILVLHLSESLALAKGGEWTGDDLVKYCTSDKPNARAKDKDEEDRVTYCLGYLEAMLTTIYLLNGKVACIPEETKKGTIVVAIVSWLKKHPDQGQYLAAGSGFLATREKWPCQ